MGFSSTWRLMAGAIVAAAVIAGCGDDDNGETAERTPASAAMPAGISEDDLPDGFTKTPTVRQNGKEWTFDNVPGHYWQVLDDGYAVGLHFQTDKPFPWAKDVEKGELLYLVYAIPGNCGTGNFEQAAKAKDATVLGPTPAGFDHWHGLVGAGPKAGHWLMHIPVRDFTMAGPPGNPMDGTPVKAGTPGFMPVCDIR